MPRETLRPPFREKPPGMRLSSLPLFWFREIFDPTRGEASQYPEFRKYNCLFGKSFDIIKALRKKFQSTVFSQPTPGWRIISTNLPAFSIMGDEALTE
jgi:hypothetical protein